MIIKKIKHMIARKKRKDQLTEKLLNCIGEINLEVRKYFWGGEIDEAYIEKKKKERDKLREQLQNEFPESWK